MVLLHGIQLFPIVWNAIRLVETTGLKVIAVIADGASPNRRFFRMHRTGANGLVYKAKNIYAADERFIYFVSDPPHLLKTIRNCWSHSFGPSSTREMQVFFKQYTMLYNVMCSFRRSMVKVSSGIILKICTRRK